MEEMIIDAPGAHCRLTMCRDSVLYVALFAFWAYLMACFFRLSLLLTAFYAAPDQAHPLIHVNTYRSVTVMLSQYGTLLLVAFTFVIGWSILNKEMFRYRDRRTSGSVVDSSQIACFFAVTPQDLALWRCGKVVSIDHADDGAVANVELVDSDPLQDRSYRFASAASRAG